ncbi:hypothetical protein OED52_13775 [Rhodococcus sp. Z13]|uniref:Uncharacterized protein n=1 Tax=Rhodococcus sacchari TaxID=2962047 RepID=A0ACD4DCJ1_9NOCA|nr:hypothetical protein [Rhodococcus sp. Z13]UYP17741.1 hypothetical protein OED52_13775 [Rhodococcus sp. Z13]
MSIRDELRNVLVGHSMRSWSSTRPKGEQVECWCGWIGEDILGHQLDQILARFGIVELPEPGAIDAQPTVHGNISEHSPADLDYLAGYLAAVSNAKAVER